MAAQPKPRDTDTAPGQTGRPLRQGNTLKVLAAVVVSFAVFVGIIAFLAARQYVSSTLASLMLVALFGLYVGFGILVVVYRLVLKLD